MLRAAYAGIAKVACSHCCAHIPEKEQVATSSTADHEAVPVYRALQQASQAHIVVDQNFPEGEMRKVNITGRLDSVERASKMVEELISGEPGSAQAIIQKVILVISHRCAQP